MKRVCVYCGSSSGSRPEYIKAAKALGRFLAEREVELVYGGASVGLMGILADETLSAGGRVIGVIPFFLKKKEIYHEHLTELKVVDSMHDRKAEMAELSDGFLALPGGWGTLDELMEILTWAQLGMHQKPVGLLNVSGYFRRLIEFLDHSVAEGFLRPENQALLLISDEIEDLFKKLDQYRPVNVEKWLRHDRI